ncbi:MAG: glycosyltransferase family 9 protein [Planctomycetota bacterium]
MPTLCPRALPRRATGHEVEHYWALAAAVRDRWAPTAPFPDSPSRTARLSPTPEHRRAAADALTATGVGPGYVALCPAATGTIAGASKVWPHWRACSEILAKRDLPLVVCPGPGEEEQCARSAPRATQLSGLGLGAYAAVLAGARRVLANDSGPMHLAAGVGAPTLGIFGVGDPQRTRPWGQHAIGDATGWPTVAAVIAAFDALPRSTGP